MQQKNAMLTWLKNSYLTKEFLAMVVLGQALYETLVATGVHVSDVGAAVIGIGSVVTVRIVRAL